MASFKQRLKQYFRVILIITTLAAISYGLMLTYQLMVKSDHFFIVQKFEIQGTTYLTHRDIVSLSKVEMGDHLLETDLQQVAKLIARSPYVKHIEVERRLPSTIYIVIDERKPIAYINSEPIKLISEDAIALPRAIDFDYPDLPILIYDKFKKVNDGDRLIGEKIETALSSLIKMKTVSTDMFSLLAEVNLNPKTAQYLAIMGGAEMRLPDNEQMSQFLTFHYFLEKMKNTNFLSEALYIDLRFKDRVIITDRKG